MPPKGSSALKQLKQRICNLLPALPCYTFPFFAFIPVITSSQISINCQILRELGWVYSKWCQGCGNHFVAVWCCLRSFPEMQLSCKCRSWCLKSSGKAQIRGVVSGLFSSHFTTNLFAHIIYLWISPFYSRTDPKLLSGSRKIVSGRTISVDFRGTSLLCEGKGVGAIPDLFPVPSTCQPDPERVLLLLCWVFFSLRKLPTWERFNWQKERYCSLRTHNINNILILSPWGWNLWSWEGGRKSRICTTAACDTLSVAGEFSSLLQPSYTKL